MQRGRLRVAAFPAACQLLPPMIRAFRRRFPAVEVILLEGSGQEISDWITTGIADLGAGLPEEDVPPKTIFTGKALRYPRNTAKSGILSTLSSGR